MKSKSITLDADKVRALLDGKYVQLKAAAVSMELGPARGGVPRWVDPVPLKCPYDVGDVLFVKERWAVDAPLEQVRRENDDAMGAGLGHGPYFYADAVHRGTGLRWRPPSTCPKWASRLSIIVTSVLRKDDEWIMLCERKKTY